MNATALLEKTRVRLRRHEGSYSEIARRFPEISYSSLTKFAHGQTENPTVMSLQALIDVLDEYEGVGPADAEGGEHQAGTTDSTAGTQP